MKKVVELKYFYTQDGFCRKSDNERVFDELLFVLYKNKDYSLEKTSLCCPYSCVITEEVEVEE